jgi:hypothetical protein
MKLTRLLYRCMRSFDKDENLWDATISGVHVPQLMASFVKGCPLSIYERQTSILPSLLACSHPPADRSFWSLLKFSRTNGNREVSSFKGLRISVWVAI